MFCGSKSLFSRIYFLSIYLRSVFTICPNITDYPYSVYLDNAHNFELTWRVDFRKELVHFRLCMKALPASVFGFGFSNYGEMENSDFVIYWTSGKGVHHFQDMYTDSEGIPHVDKKQDYKLKNVQTQGEHVILVFDRKFDTCDEHDYIFDRGTTHVIYFSSEQPMKAFTLGHVTLSDLSSGLQRIQLLKPDISPNPMPANTWTFEVTAPNIEVPPTETTYWWYVATLPPLRQKHHIIKYEGVIQSGHENLVHHMEVFHCEVAGNEIIRFFNGPGLAEGKPSELEACRKVIGAWAMGAAAMVLPEEAGFPLGGANFSRFVLLEVHYNNPDKVKGMKDASGIRFYVTSSLRRHDAGIMELGLEYTNKMAIPPRQDNFLLTGYCIAECTKMGLPPEGIFIYASQLHTHLTGRRVYTKHVRNGVELPELNRDNHYSPHFQEIRRLPLPVRIIPGDALITTCEDRTKDRNNATLGGFAITDEMCVNYVHYYPATNLEVCKSSVSSNALKKFFTFMNDWDLDDTSAGKGDRSNYRSIRWTPLTTLLLKTLYMTSPISMQCNQSDGTRFPGVWEDVQLTKVQQPLVLPARQCKNRDV